MNKYNYILGESIKIVILTNEKDRSLTFLNNEYLDFFDNNTNNDDIVVGIVKLSENKFLSYKYKELVSNCLYEDDQFLYVHYENHNLRISLNKDCFEIVYERNLNSKVIFSTLEVLIRIYAYKFGIDFFHASSYIYNGNTFMLNGFGGSGKTEIMVDFLLKGAEFLSDDLVIINENAEIFPYRVSIPVTWRSVTDDFIKKMNISPTLYKICNLCRDKRNPLAQSIYSRFAWKYMLGNYSHKQLTENVAPLKFYSVDECIWLQEANFGGPFDFSRDDFYRYMNLCLQNESRKYFDLEGFLALKFPFLNEFTKEREILREKICSKLDVTGLAVNNGDLKSAISYLKTL